MIVNFAFYLAMIPPKLLVECVKAVQRHQIYPNIDIGANPNCDRVSVATFQG